MLKVFKGGCIDVTVLDGVGQGSGNSYRTRVRFAFDQPVELISPAADICADCRGVEHDVLQFDIVGEWERREFFEMLRLVVKYEDDCNEDSYQTVLAKRLTGLDDVS